MIVIQYGVVAQLDAQYRSDGYNELALFRGEGSDQRIVANETMTMPQQQTLDLSRDPNILEIK